MRATTTTTGLLLRLLLGGLLALRGARALTRDDLYPHGRGLDQQLPPGDDVSSDEIELRVPIRFYGEDQPFVYVNTNGLLSFLTHISQFINIEFPIGYPVIAPFYANADTTKTGTVYYRETSDAYVLAKAEEDLRACFPDHYGARAESVFVATWSDVGAHRSKSEEVNTYQVAVISGGNESYAVLMYPENGIQWTQAWPKNKGLTDARGQIGITSDEGKAFIMKNSGHENVRNVPSLSNCNVPGKYMYRIGNVQRTVEEPRQFVNPVLENQSTLSCALGGSKICHYRATCIDRAQGFYCECGDNYYGNGRNCVKKDIPLRVNGKLNSVINGELIGDIDLQSYVVLIDGRTYSALSNVPERIGSAMQTLSVIGGNIGWLFAKPLGKAKNGYQITGGVFNNSIEVLFTDTNQKVAIHAQYLGMDVFDQLRMRADVKGSLPKVPSLARLDTEDYAEPWTMVRPGTMRSQSKRVYKSSELLVEYPCVVTQTIEYDSYLPRDEAQLEPMTLKVGKNYLSYETRDQIIRYGMSNRIMSVGQEDPCIEGRRHCGAHSSCLVENDSFRCVCNKGYDSFSSDDRPICEDVDECALGTHDCDDNAECLNVQGSYTCRCRPGYDGDGTRCREVLPCDDVRCHAEARCYDVRGVALCRCNEGFEGDGRASCAPARPARPPSAGCDAVDNCSPYAACIQPEEDGEFVCECLSGYEGDGYTCRYAEEETTTEIAEEPKEPVVDAACTFGECWCPFGYDLEGNLCYLRSEEPVSSESPPVTPPDREIAYPLPACFDADNLDSCACPWGFDYHRDSHRCRVQPGVSFNTKGPSGSAPIEPRFPESCDVVNNCHPYAQCLYDFAIERHECRCTAGFEGDGVFCSAIEVSCEDADVCDPNASCEFDPATTQSICVCKRGYHGNGHSCAANDCATNDDCKENAECLNAPTLSRRICVCREGYMPDANLDCVEVAPIAENCNGARCVEHATCTWDPDLKIDYCQCDEGYHGEGVDGCSREPSAPDCSTMDNCDVNAACIPEAGRYVCECLPGYEGDGFVCQPPQTCLQNPYMCSSRASCVPRAGSFACDCNPGYAGNGTVCKRIVKSEGNFLVVNQGVATLRIPYVPTAQDAPRPIQLAYYQMAVGLDVDCREGRVYWSDITGRSIKSSNYDGTIAENTFVSDIISPEGISIDWVSRNIFWTDSRKDTIEVANLDTKVRKVLFSTGLADPRGIAAHPYKGKLFWSDWNRKDPKIEWSNMDGTNREVFLDSSEVTLPNSLAIDWETDELCFGDAGRKTVNCVQIDTRERRVIAQNCSYPFGMAVSATTYYWTDWTTQKIESVDKETLTRLAPIETPLGGRDKRLYEVVAVSEGCRDMSNACQHDNGQCPPSDLCLLNGRGGRTCACGTPFSGPSTCAT